MFFLARGTLESSARVGPLHLVPMTSVFFVLFSQDLGKGEDPMEGGRGVLPPHRRKTMGRYFLDVLR